MALHKIKDFYPEKIDDERDVKGLDLYAQDEKIGSVDDVLVDDQGQFRFSKLVAGSRAKK
jgi:uncharacterized protein YrrD